MVLERLKRLATRHRQQELIATIRLAVVLLVLRAYCALTRRKLVVIVLLETLGDVVASLPVATYMRSQMPRSLILWLCKPAYREILLHNPDIDRVFSAPCLKSWARVRRLNLEHREVHLNIPGRGCAECGGGRDLIDPSKSPVTLRNFLHQGGLLPALCLAAGLPALSNSPRLHFPADIEGRLARFRLPKEYLVFHATSLDPVKDWRVDKWRQFAGFIADRLQMNVIEVGTVSVFGCDLPANVINLCGKTSLLETAAIIDRATVFVGIDSGPAHLANAVRCQSVILFGKYYHFGDYSPFTGFFAEGGATFLRSSGAVSELSVSEIVDAVARRIAQKRISENNGDSSKREGAWRNDMPARLAVMAPDPESLD